MEQITTLLKAFFIAITVLTVWQFYRASNNSKPFLILILAWVAVQFGIVQTGFYANSNAVPPRLMFQLAPTLIFILALFLTVRGRNFIDNLNIKQLTLIHTIRVPVEIVLYYLFIAKAIPQIMTFEGRNFDILAGLTAPVIFYFGFVKNKISRKGILVWNVLSLGLLANIILIAVLSAKSPFQQFAFNETNIALGHFPFNWLPSVVVPIVLLSHLATIRQLITNPKKQDL
jgi:hypothetical protein